MGSGIDAEYMGKYGEGRIWKIDLHTELTVLEVVKYHGRTRVRVDRPKDGWTDEKGYIPDATDGWINERDDYGHLTLGSPRFLVKSKASSTLTTRKMFRVNGSR